MRPLLIILAAVALIGIHPPLANDHVQAEDSHPLDTAHNAPIPCEAVATPGAVPRSARNVVHVANVCGFVGTDVEFQSRTLADGSVRDYAFVGTMGAGLRIFDITDPAHPFIAGSYADPGWQGDVQVRGDVAVIAFDPLAAAAPKTSACLLAKNATAGGVDIVRLHFDPNTGSFSTALIACVPNGGGTPTGQNGAHNATMHPSGEYVVMINSRGNGSVDIVDLRGTAQHRWRLVQAASLTHATCTTSLPAGVACVSIGRPGTWSPHDVSFSADGRTMYVAAVGSDTVIVDVSNVLGGQASVIGVAPNSGVASSVGDRETVTISHQSDTTADGAILIVTDEAGGGLSETRCNTSATGKIGAMHFWALREIPGVPASAGASPATPQKIGAWVYPNPMLGVDPLASVLTSLGRTERACTIHVFRAGGNGTAGPGEIAAGYGGVSGLPGRQLVSAHYGAGVWWLDITARATSADGFAEDGRSTWANTLGWNVMPGAETWSAKEYKGFIYAGDMGRGFDVYAFGSCEGAGCVLRPTSTVGSVRGGGKLEGEILIVRGTTAGGRAQFGIDVSYGPGALAPTGSLTFRDKTLDKRVQATSFDSLAVAGAKATLTGLATVNGVPGVRFFVEVEDLGGPGTGDLFRIVLADGYGALGRVEKGNVTVSSSP